jgi:protein-S-isoprenylcysteine O-methyltransferase Ste14
MRASGAKTWVEASAEARDSINFRVAFATKGQRGNGLAGRIGEPMDDESETAGVAAPPPLLYAGALAFGLAVSRLQPDAEKRARFARTWGTVAVVAGVGIGFAAISALKRAGTNIDPYKPSTALVTDGIFALSRNPAYVGATSIYIGIAMYACSVPAFTLLPIVLALLDRLVVSREERYLERRFGADYRRYRDAVPRWF